MNYIATLLQRNLINKFNILIQDPVMREAREAMIKTYGQTPKQLFKKPHPMVQKNWTEVNKENDPPDMVKVLDSVIGLKWGDYVGSPEHSDPAIVWRGFQSKKVDSFLALETNEVYGLAKKSALVFKYQENCHNCYLAGAAVISFDFPDDIIRMRIRKSEGFVILKVHEMDQKPVIMKVSPESNNPQLWLGFESGRILVQNLHFNPQDLTLTLGRNQVFLQGHESVIQCMDICPEFGITVTGSSDNSAIIWATKSPKIIRSLTLDDPVNCVSISKTSGDIALSTVNTKTLHLFTINGKPISKSVCPHPITALTFSKAKEGISCNVVVSGHQNGEIVLWNSWTLNPIRTISVWPKSSAVVTLTFSFDNQNLYASTDENEVVIFEKAEVGGIVNAPKFVSLVSSI